MPVIAVDKDETNATMTMTAQFAAPPERVWQVLADPRQLERWWGPPMYPAKVLAHDLTPGGFVTYVMTGPEGDAHHGWWKITDVKPPQLVVFEDGFGEQPGVNPEGMPMTICEISLTEHEDGTRMQVLSRFPSGEAMSQLLEMGAADGMTEAMNQIDALVA